MHTSMSEKNTDVPTTPAAIASGPIRPIMMTSTKPIAICVSCVSARGTASTSVARSSRRRIGNGSTRDPEGGAWRPVLKDPLNE